MRSFGVWEPETRERVDFSVWYPSSAASVEAINEGWIVEAGRRGRMLPGFYPVVLVSHDTASGRFANNDLAAALASAGMLVIVPTHTGDNQNSGEDIFTAKLVRDRPRHLLRALETVLGSPDFAPYADESRIGLVGVGFGSITAMQLAGAAPDFSRLAGYCSSGEARQFMEDAFCAPWTRERLSRLPEEMDALSKNHKNEVFTPSLAFFSPPLLAVVVPPEDMQRETAPVRPQTSRPWWQRLFGDAEEEETRQQQVETVSVKAPPEPAPPQGETTPTSNFPLLLDFQGGPLFGGTDSGAAFVHISLPDSPQFRVTVSDDVSGSMASPEPAPSPPHPGKRVYRRPASARSIKGIALVAPAGGMVFAPEALGSIRIPVAVIEAGQDALYPPGRHAKPYLVGLPSLPLELSLEEADHFSLFARCARETMINLGEACGRLVGDKRQFVGEQRNRFLVSFFQTVLGGALPEAVPSGYVAAPKE